LIFVQLGLYAQNTKLNIAVLDLDPTNIREDDSRFLSDRLRIELFESGVFNVVEREKMNSILKEQGFQMSGCTSLECAVEVGQLLNVNQMVGGSIGRIENVYSITIRLINVETGALERTAKRDFRGSLSGMLTEVIPALADELSRSGEAVPKKEEPLKMTEQKSDAKWGLQLSFGGAAYGLIGDMNTSIRDLNEDYPYAALPEFSQFNSFAINIALEYDNYWRYNFGLQVSPLSSEWKYRIEDFEFNGNTFSRVEFSRNFNFAYVYAGADYKINLTKSFLIYLGANLGFNGLTSTYEVRFDGPTSVLDFRKEKKYSYVILAIKLDGGVEYKLNETISLALELSPLIQTSYDTKDEYPDFNAASVFKDAIFPEKMNGSGIIATFSVTYYF
jgi:hypothetical protein